MRDAGRTPATDDVLAPCAAEAVAPGVGRWDRAIVGAVRALGTAHVLAGMLVILGIGVSFLLRAGDYIGTPLEVSSFGAGVAFAALAAQVTTFGYATPAELKRYQWIYAALRDDTGLAVLAMVHLNLAALLVALGYGLRRGWPWARRWDLRLLALGGVLAILHAAALARM